ncbi:MAG: J domain-containing protein [Bacteroidales bacterium]
MKSKVTARDHYRMLGLLPGASESEIKAAYRKLAFKFHPDRNLDPEAAVRFRQINESYEFLLKHGEEVDSPEDERRAQYVDELLRREREMRQRARVNQERKKKEADYFNRPEWHDPLLLLRYGGRVVWLAFAVGAILFPVYLAVFVDPASLLGTSLLLLAGVISWLFILPQRGRFFRLGRLHTSWKDVVLFFRRIPGKDDGDACCFCPGEVADGKPCRIELLKTLEIRTLTRGAMDHEVGYKNKVRRVVLPRSSKAQQMHRISSLVKVTALLVCLIALPFSSFLWRFVAGLAVAAALSIVLLRVAGVRSKASYLFTPGLAIKIGIWVLALSRISTFGPGFNVETSGWVYLTVAGLIFFLDMAFDLVVGFFPFYGRMFIPLFRQGRVLTDLYNEGFRNYQEFPVYSLFYPMIRWLF